MAYEEDTPLTDKQEACCQFYIECSGNQSEAYRCAYNCDNMSKKTVWEAASRLFAQCNVSARVLELQGEHRERHNVTIDSITTELDENREVGRAEKQSAAMTSATMGKAKIHGLVVDKASVDHTSNDRSMSPSSLDMSKLSTDTIKELLAARESAAKD